MSLPVFLGSSEDVSPYLTSKGVSRQDGAVYTFYIHITVLEDEAEASTDRCQRVSLCLGIEPIHKVQAYTPHGSL